MVQFTSRAYLFTLAVACLLALGACTSKSDPNPPNNNDNNTAASMTTRIQDLRSGSGAAELNEDDTLAAVAQAQAEYNASHSINSDTNAGGKTIAQQLIDGGYNHNSVAYLFNNLGESATFNEWKTNPAYSGIMLDDSFTDIGVGTAANGSVHRWVVIFATKGTPSNSTVDQMLTKLNEFRTLEGAPAFVINDNLAAVAQAQAEHNASVQHNDAASDTDVGLEDQVANTGYTYGFMMWTLANGDADAAVNIWTDTQSEHDRMVDPVFKDVGIGVASGGTKQWWVVVYAEPITPAP
jgi:uncharacterized protein YkwD